MSKQVGLIKVKGNLDGVSFYQSDGENFVRMAKGPDKKRIQTDPAYQRTRENNSEFGGSATAAKAFRKTLTPVIKMGDRRLIGRTVKLCKTIASKGKGVRGKRSIDISVHGKVFEKLEINERLTLEMAFTGIFTPQHSEARNTATITIENLDTKQSVLAVPGATHFRFIQVLGVVSDYAFNPDTARYEAVEPKLDSKYGVGYSDYLPLERGQPLTINLAVALPGAPVLSPKTLVVQGLGISFYEELEDGFYPVKQADAFRIVEVF